MRAVNLIPPDQRSGQRVGAGRSQGGAYAVLALVAGLALMAFLYGKADHEISSSRTQVATLTAESQRAESEAGQLAPYTSFMALREQRVQAVQTLLESRFDWAHAFHELGRVLPSGISINSLTGNVGTPGTSGATASTSSSSSKASSPSPSGSASSSSSSSSSSAVASATPPGTVPTFELTGCATNQRLVADMLGRLKLIDGVSEVQLVSSISTSGGGGSGGGGGCPGHDPAYTVQVLFDPLPSGPAVVSATQTVADHGSTRSSGGGSTSASSGGAAGGIG